MKKSKLGITLLLIYSFPFPWLAIYWDAVGNGHSLMFYMISGVALGIATRIAVSTGDGRLVLPGNLLSVITSMVATRIFDVGDMNHFFKPFTYHSRIVLPVLLNFIFQALFVMFALFARAGRKKGDNN